MQFAAFFVDCELSDPTPRDMFIFRLRKSAHVTYRVRFRLTKVSVFIKISLAVATFQRFEPDFHEHLNRLLCRKSVKAKLPLVRVLGSAHGAMLHPWKHSHASQRLSVPNSTPQPQYTSPLNSQTVAPRH